MLLLYLYASYLKLPLGFPRFTSASLQETYANYFRAFFYFVSFQIHTASTLRRRRRQRCYAAYYFARLILRLQHFGFVGYTPYRCFMSIRYFIRTTVSLISGWLPFQIPAEIEQLLSRLDESSRSLQTIYLCALAISLSRLATPPPRHHFTVAISN